MPCPPRRILITDLDGTLLNQERKVSPADRDALQRCPDHGIVRVVATGRNLYSAHKVLTPDFPIDYLIFSSGAGLVDWPRQELLLARSFTAAETARIAGVLTRLDVNFMVHRPIPDNHRFAFHQVREEDTDFGRRFQLYAEFATRLDGTGAALGESCQFVVILPHDLDRFAAVRDAIAGAKVIRTTSPLDGRSLWIEIFPVTVSKALTAEWLAARLGLGREHTLGLGNDYNDLDLLEWTGRSLVVANAPPDLKARFQVVASHNESPLSDALTRVGLFAARDT